MSGDPPKIYIGIDPAMANTGVTMWVEGESEISTALVKPEREHNPKEAKTRKHDFRFIYEQGKSITRQIGGMLRPLAAAGCRVQVIMEHPPPAGQWSTGLFLVDGLILSRLHRLGWSVHLAHPTRIDGLLTSTDDPNTPVHLQKKTRFQKRERREFLFQLLEKNNLGVRTGPGVRKNKKLSYDETDAGLLMLYLIHNLHSKLQLLPTMVEERWLLKEVPIHA